MEYRSVAQMAEQWGISDRRVRILCQQGKIDGVIRKGRAWLIPADAEKPIDGRTTRYQRNDSPYAELLAEVDALKADLDKHRPLTQGELQRLREEFLIEYTYNSNAIEGNTLTLQETALVLEGITVDKKPLKDHLEAVGHRDAFLYVQDVAKQEIPLSETVIKNIHALVLMNRPDDKGVYRRIPVRIMGAYTEPVQPYMIEPRMAELLSANEERKNTMTDIERIALFHLEFEGIHPFIDGNGRTGRLILNLDLIRNGYPPINVKFTDRKRYYDSFDAFYKDNDPTAMTELIAEYIDLRFDDYFAVLERNID